MLLILYFTSWYIFQRKSKEWEFSLVLLFFFKWALKQLGVFLVGSNCINTEDNYRCLIEFMKKISEFPCLIL